ncbi:MAG: hypothetical protein KDD11_14130 [Acidobacteria bacterium]|nr:hypothetical protein [Acidobacteriota bacterium]
MTGVLATASCVAAPPLGANHPTQLDASSVSEILHSQNKDGVNAIADGIVDGTIRIEKPWLLDDAAEDISFSVRNVSIVEGVTHLGVKSVSQFSMCLLELREKTDSREILRNISPDLVSQLTSVNCGVCCSLVFELPPEVESTLRGYWLSQLFHEE